MAQFDQKKLISLLAMCGLVSGATLLILYQAMTKVSALIFAQSLWLQSDNFMIFWWTAVKIMKLRLSW
jgi:hypothetical protein